MDTDPEHNYLEEVVDLDRGNVQVEGVVVVVARKEHFAVDSVDVVGCILDLVLRIAGLGDVVAAAAAVSCTGSLLLAKIAAGA